VPKQNLSKFLSALVFDNGNEIFSDVELLETGDCFLKNNLNLSETAREMYIHRNTLTYRLEKIEKLTGLDIKKFSDALNFRILYILYKTINYEK
jgi:carbohydrate diacid regulator